MEVKAMYPMNNYLNQYQYPNPYANNSFNSSPFSQSQSLIRVTGIEGAKAYSQMNPNSTVALFDSNEDVMYIKSTDGAGFPTIRTFRFEEMVPTQMSGPNSKDYVSREEMEEYVKQFIQQTKKQNGQSNSNGQQH